MKGYDERYQWLSGVPGHMSPREIRSAPHCLVRLSPTLRKRVRIGAILVCLLFVMFSSVRREPRRQAGQIIVRTNDVAVTACAGLLGAGISAIGQRAASPSETATHACATVSMSIPRRR
ncbi:hypothetical protein DF036_35400 [Burkholderia contaminans]|nr:hypothetical protein DF036_35400 [Burkholderia contaminans]